VAISLEIPEFVRSVNSSGNRSGRLVIFSANSEGFLSVLRG
jgi:hypothetical protein